MTITYSKAGQCVVKTKDTSLVITLQPDRHAVKIKDMELPGPGEYEVSEIFAQITPNLGHFLVEEMVVVWLDSSRQFTEEELAELEQVDVLLVHVHTGSQDELQAITKLLGKLEPRVLVLLGIQDPEAFSKVEGQIPEIVTTVKLARKDLPEEERRVFVLQPA